MKIALVYDRVNKFGGAERVLQALHQLYPTAPLYTSVYDPLGAPWANDWDIRPSFLQTIPFARNHHELFVMMMPAAFKSFDFSAFDLVISVTSAEAKGIVVKPPTQHLCYLLTPTRYLWSHTHHYVGRGLRKMLKLPFISKLRQWDYDAAQTPNTYLAISQTVASRCLKYYRRPVAGIIYPPVNTAIFSHHPHCCFTPKHGFYLVVSRLVPYKHVKTVIHAFQNLPDEELLIVGSGSQKAELIAHAKIASNITFMGDISDESLACLYHHAQALIFPQDEDFGIVALEAQAAGLPVIALNQGGATETVLPGITGILYDENEPAMIVNAINQAKQIKWQVKVIQQHAAQFDQQVFLAKFSQFVNTYVKSK
jgi:glycosyltransferase involved in cell wall biosynthesis